MSAMQTCKGSSINRGSHFLSSSFCFWDFLGVKPFWLRAAAAAALPAWPGVNPCPLNLASWLLMALTAFLASLVS